MTFEGAGLAEAKANIERNTKRRVNFRSTEGVFFVIFILNGLDVDERALVELDSNVDETR